MSEDKKPEVAVVPQPRAPRAFSLMPTSLGEAREIAELIATSDFAPKDYRGKPGNVIIALQMGADLGLKPMQALQNIAIINGRPSIYGDAALALAMPALEAFEEFFEGDPKSDDYRAVCVAKRKGWPKETRRTFSVLDAKRAGLWQKAGPWTQYPQRMLMWRARGFTLRDVAADFLLGLILAEEAQDYPVEATVTHQPHPQAALPPADPMERIPEGFRENIGKGFEVLNLANGARLAKINEYMSEGDPDDQAAKLLDWLKDEYAKRKTGKPRVKGTKKAGDNGKTTAPPPAKSAPQKPPTESNEQPDVTAEDIPFAGVQGEGEMF